jgi:hypothetical protein
MYIFAKFVADYIFLQNRDKINIKKFPRCICDIQSHFLLSLDNEFGTVPDKSYHQSRMPRFGKKVGNVLASPGHIDPLPIFRLSFPFCTCAALASTRENRIPSLRCARHWRRCDTQQRRGARLLRQGRAAAIQACGGERRQHGERQLGRAAHAWNNSCAGERLLLRVHARGRASEALGQSRAGACSGGVVPSQAGLDNDG